MALEFETPGLNCVKVLKSGLKFPIMHLCLHIWLSRCVNALCKTCVWICMEACFCHRMKNKKGNCDFLSRNSDFFSQNC